MTIKYMLPIMALSASALCGPALAATSTRQIAFLDFTQIPVNSGPEVSNPIAENSINPIVERIMAQHFSQTHESNRFVVAAATQPGGDETVTTSAACQDMHYTPSARLKFEAETRRKILFPLVAHIACTEGVATGLLDRLIIQESRYNPLAISPKGAFGLTQLMPMTSVQMGTNTYDILDNIRGGARYLRRQLNEFGQVPLALAAYNAGPARVRRVMRVPAISETQNYVRAIMGAPLPSSNSIRSPIRTIYYQNFFAKFLDTPIN